MSIRSGVAHVLQIAADPAAIADVLDHLFYQAGEHGASAVTGRLEPRFLQALSDNTCVLHRRGPWVLLNARRAELLHSFECGDAVFSRLDGNGLWVSEKGTPSTPNLQLPTPKDEPSNNRVRVPPRSLLADLHPVVRSDFPWS